MYICKFYIHTYIYIHVILLGFCLSKFGIDMCGFTTPDLYPLANSPNGAVHWFS